MKDPGAGAPERQWGTKPPQDDREFYYRAFPRVGTEPYSSGYVSSHVFLESYPVIRRTPKGAWIDAGLCSPHRFILDDATKRWAYPTKELAIESLYRRYAMHQKRLIDQLHKANAVLAALTRYKAGLMPADFVCCDRDPRPEEELFPF